MIAARQILSDFSNVCIALFVEKNPRIVMYLLQLSASLVKAKFHYAVQLATSSRAGLRPARELVADLLASKIA